MDEKEDYELGVRVAVHLVGEAFENENYTFWCHDYSHSPFSSFYECVVQKYSPQGGKYTPKSFSLSFIIYDGNGYVGIKFPNISAQAPTFTYYLLADPDISNKIVSAILKK